MQERLKEDHLNAIRLAEGISEIEGLSIEPERVKTNIIYFDLKSKSFTPEEFIKRLFDKGIKLLQTGPRRFRMVTHYGISNKDVEITIKVVKEIIKDAQ
jgi:threonine aldolase